MKMDKYGEVINSPETYEAIAKRLTVHHAVLIGWSDEHYTHYDILFTYGADATIGQMVNGEFVGDHFLSGSFQGGIRPTDLFVSIMRVGSFGFEVDQTETDAGYYQEKLGRNFKFGDESAEKIAQLINGIKKELLKIIKI